MNTNEGNSFSMIKLVGQYLTAKETVIKQGYTQEIDWQDQLCFSNVTESDFLRESAWVILSAGMRESVIRKKFKDITIAFSNWNSAKDIVENKYSYQNNALRVFANKPKIYAIVEVSKRIWKEGYQSIRDKIEKHGVRYLKKFDYIGPVTSYHLAKNIGLDVVKPDRHLVRVAQSASYPDPHSLCQAISNETGDKLSVVDLVIWRFATIYPLYVDFFKA